MYLMFSWLFICNLLILEISPYIIKVCLYNNLSSQAQLKPSMKTASNLLISIVMLCLLQSVKNACLTGCSGCLCDICADANNCAACINGYGAALNSAGIKVCQACPPNCVKCAYDNNTCTDCRQGFGVIAGGGCGLCVDAGCLRCTHDANQCLQCIFVQGRGLYMGTCVPCNATNCKICFPNSQICLSCHGRYGLVNGSCLSCTDTNCNNCDGDPSNCSQCVPQYTMYLGACTSCFDGNCQICQDGDPSVCTLCENLGGHGLDAGMCVSCVSSHCSNCRTNASECVTCQTGYGVVSGVCLQCSDPLCQHCQGSINNCIRCPLMYGIIGGQCIACADPNCVACMNDTNNCSSCNYSYGVNQSYQCSTCIDSNCALCFTNYTYCDGCNTGYVATNGACILYVCVDPLCDFCPMATTFCQGCKVGYGLQSGLCVTCVPPCLTCSPLSAVSCLSCTHEFYVSGPSVCSACLSGCKTCQNSTICEQCKQGYYMDTLFACPPCPIKCFNCFLNTVHNAPECINCIAGYELDQNTPPTCQQICGDGLTTQYPCDTQTGVPYDGCTDTCQVQDDFQCYVTSNQTICSYNSSLQISFVSLKMKEINKVTLQISIFPPLYIFSQLPPQSLFQLFTVQSEALTCYEANFNHLTNTISFSCDLTTSVQQNQTIQVLFNPLNSSIPQFHVSVESTGMLIINRNIAYYNSGDLDLLKTGGLLLYVVVGIGWVSWLIGLFLKKLPGLQAIFVLQYSLLPLIFLSSQFKLDLLALSPLKYSAGYSISLMPEDQFQSTNSPYLSQFKISQGYLSNNFNIPAAVMVLASIPLVITSIRLKMFMKQFKNLRKVRDGKEKQAAQAQLQTRIEQSQRAHSTFMYICLSFFVYFTAFSIICFKLGVIIHFSNLAIFSICVLLYLFIVIQFCRDPTCFDYFRYSFRITNLAMNHYYIHISILLTSIALLTILPTYSWIAAAPLLLMTIYTLAYRPYKQTKDNLRSSLNYLTMLFFVAFKAYLEMTPKQKYSKQISLAFLMVGTLFLLTVVIVSLVCSIHSYYYEDYLPNKEEKSEIDKTEKAENAEKSNWRYRMKILKQLGYVDCKKNVKAIEKDLTLRQIFESDLDTNILNISNTLKQQYLKQELQRVKSAQKQSLIKQQASSNNKLYQEYKKKLQCQRLAMQIKREQLSNKDKKNIAKNAQYGTLDRLQKTKLNGKLTDAKQKAIKQLPKKEDIAKQILAEENRHIQLKVAAEVIYQQMDKVDPDQDKLIEAFNNIKIP